MTTTDEFADQMRPALPNHAHIRATYGVAWGATWTTPAGTHTLDAITGRHGRERPISAVKVDGPGYAFALTAPHATADTTTALLRLLGAIEPLHQADPSDDDALTIATYAAALADATWTRTDTGIAITETDHANAAIDARDALDAIRAGATITTLPGTPLPADPMQPALTPGPDAQQVLDHALGEAPLCCAPSPRGHTCTLPTGHQPFIGPDGELWDHAIPEINIRWTGNTQIPIPEATR